MTQRITAKRPSPSSAMKAAMKMGWTAMVNRSKRPSVYITDAEIDALQREYFARGGSVKQCPPMGAMGDVPVEVE